MLIVINREQLLDFLFEIFKVQEIQQVIGQLVSRTFQNRQIKSVMSSETDVFDMGIYLIFNIALTLILAGRQH